MIGVIAKLKIKPETAQQFEELAEELASHSRAEAACRGYTLWRTQDPAIYTFVEYYDDEAGIEAHGKSEHYRRIGRQLGPLLDGAPEITRLLPVNS